MSRPRATLRLTAAALALAASGCSPLEIDVPREIPEQRVSGSIVSQLLDGFFENPIPIDVNVAQETAARDAGPACAVRLGAVSLAITDTAVGAGDSDDFGFIDTVTLEVESTRPDSALPKVEVGRIDSVPAGATELNFVTSETDLLPYVEEGARITSRASGSAPPDDVTFAGSYVILIEVL